jgi:hypothetical protein
MKEIITEEVVINAINVAAGSQLLNDDWIPDRADGIFVLDMDRPKYRSG